MATSLHKTFNYNFICPSVIDRIKPIFIPSFCSFVPWTQQAQARPFIKLPFARNAVTLKILRNYSSVNTKAPCLSFNNADLDKLDILLSLKGKSGVYM
jgi:hypothetical protein